MAAALPQRIQMSVSEYLRFYTETPFEYINGFLEEKYVGKRTHSRLRFLIEMWLETKSASHGTRVYSETHVLISDGVYRIPDIVVMPANHKDEEILTEPPLCTMEIISEKEPLGEVVAKLNDHRSMGVPTCLAVDPYRRSVYILNGANLLEGVPLTQQIEIATPNGSMVVPFAQLFDELD